MYKGDDSFICVSFTSSVQYTLNPHNSIAIITGLNTTDIMTGFFLYEPSLQYVFIVFNINISPQSHSTVLSALYRICKSSFQNALINEKIVNISATFL